MLSLDPQTPVFIFNKAIDFRCGIDKLIIIVKNLILSDPYSGAFFMFRNRRMTGAKLLMFDGTGFWLCQRRLSEGRFPWWPSEQGVSDLDHEQILLLLQGINPFGVGDSFWQEVEAFDEEARKARPSFEWRAIRRASQAAC